MPIIFIVYVDYEFPLGQYRDINVVKVGVISCDSLDNLNPYSECRNSFYSFIHSLLAMGKSHGNLRLCHSICIK